MKYFEPLRLLLEYILNWKSYKIVTESLWKINCEIRYKKKFKVLMIYYMHAFIEKKNRNKNIRINIVICIILLEQYNAHINTLFTKHRTERFVPNIKCFMLDKICLMLNANSKIPNALYRVLYILNKIQYRTLHAKRHIRITHAKKRGNQWQKGQTKENSWKGKKVHQKQKTTKQQKGILKSVILTT